MTSDILKDFLACSDRKKFLSYKFLQVRDTFLGTNDLSSDEVWDIKIGLCVLANLQTKAGIASFDKITILGIFVRDSLHSTDEKSYEVSWRDSGGCLNLNDTNRNNRAIVCLDFDDNNFFRALSTKSPPLV